MCMIHCIIQPRASCTSQPYTASCSPEHHAQANHTLHHTAQSIMHKPTIHCIIQPRASCTSQPYTASYSPELHKPTIHCIMQPRAPQANHTRTHRRWNTNLITKPVPTMSAARIRSVTTSATPRMPIMRATVILTPVAPPSLYSNLHWSHWNADVLLVEMFLQRSAQCNARAVQCTQYTRARTHTYTQCRCLVEEKVELDMSGLAAGNGWRW